MRSHTTRLSRASGVVALAVGLAACGSTVQLDRAARSVPGAGAQVPELDADGTSTTPATAPGTHPAAGTGDPGTRLVPAPADAAAAPGLGTLPAPASGVDGPGVTATTITFGVPYVVKSEEANEALGGSEYAPEDTRRYYNAVVDEVNRSGGVAGRKLVASYFAVSASNPQSADQQASAACDYWTHDVKTFVLFDALNEVLRSCAERNGKLAFNGGAGGVDTVSATYTRYPHYLEPSGIRLDALASATVAGLAKTDYYGKAPVVGVVTWDSPNYRTAVSAGVRPALTRLGLTLKVAEYVHVPETVAALSSSSASISSAILKLRQEGVTHAFVLDGPAGVALGGVLSLLWMNAASSQKYYPRYGFNDNNSPEVSAKDRGDLRGSRWVSMFNGHAVTDAGGTRNQRREECFGVMRRHGLAPDDTQLPYMLHACDDVWFLRDVLGTSRAVVNRDRFMALAEALGTTYRSPYTFRTRLSVGRHDGVDAFRSLAFDEDCDCFRYVSGVYARAV